MSMPEERTDFVVPMVFPDGEWLAEYLRAGGSVAGPQRHVRFRSWGTEELLVRCVLRFMPWVGTVRLLLASPSQLRPWMEPLAASGRVSVHFHRDFIPAEYLPCFTSPTIEMFLHRIPGLARRFVYGNDDMFPLSPLAEDDFFRGGLPCQHLTEHPFPARPNLFQRKCLNQQNMIAAPFGLHFSRTWLRNGHSLQPVLLDTCEEVWRLHGDGIRRRLSPVRRTDHSYSQYAYALQQHFSGAFADHVPPRRYAGPDTPLRDLAAAIRDPQAGIVCINDSERITDWEARAGVVRREIERKLEE